MNHSVYIFGDFGSGYTQYPDDFAKRILAKRADDLKANTQIALHREGDLIYYCYYRKLLGGSSPKGYVGFSICFNGVFCSDIGALFDIFEQCVTDVAVSGRIIEFSTDGDLQTKASSLYLQDVEVDRICASLTNEIGRLSSTVFKDLPPFNYGAGIIRKKECSYVEVERELPKLIKTINNIIIHKDTSYKSSQFIGFAKQLSDLNSANQDLRSQNRSLNEQVVSLNKQKKQYKLVSILATIVVLAIVGIIVFGHNIVTLRGEVENRDSIIEEKNERIESLENEVSKKEKKIGSLYRDIELKDAKIKQIDSFMVSFASVTLCPIAVSSIEVKNGDGEYGDTIYSSATTYIYSRISVQSLIEGTVEIYVKFYAPYGLSYNNDSPSGYSFTSSVSLSKNQTSIIGISGWGSSTKGIWQSGSYRIEYWYNDFCLGKKSFTIY